LQTRSTLHCEQPSFGVSAPTSPTLTNPQIAALYARFLDKEFPETPRVVPDNTAALQSSFHRTVRDLMVWPIAPLIMATNIQKLDEKCVPYFRKTREKAFGMKLEEISPPGPKRDAVLQAALKQFSLLAEILNTNGPARTGCWVMGEEVGPTFADFAIGGILKWVNIMADEEVWNAVSAWNGGRWKAHLDRLEPWSKAP
jgi:hypothetical protein